MGNTIRGETTIRLAGKDYRYSLNWGTMAATEATLHARRGTRESFMEFLRRANAWGIEDVIVLLLAGLRRHHPDVTEEQLAETLGLDDFAAFQVAFGALCKDAMGPAAKKDEPADRPQTPQETPAGTSS